MKLPVFLHQFDSGYANAALGVDDRALPISELWGKTNDGLRWQATWDAHAAEIGGLEAVVHAEHEIYAPQGIDYRPWGVVHGRWVGHPVAGVEGYAAREGRLAASIARAAAGPGQPAVYIADLEPHYHAPFPAFWRDDLGAGPADVTAFLEAFTNGGGRELWPTVDARDPHLAPVAFEVWAAHRVVTRVVPQVYFTDFVRPRAPTSADVRSALERAVATLGAHGWNEVADVWPALPGDATPDRMLEAVEHSHRLGCGGVAVWQRANLRADTAAALDALADPWAEPPAPQTPPDEVRSAAVHSQLAVARGALDALEALVAPEGH